MGPSTSAPGVERAQHQFELSIVRIGPNTVMRTLQAMRELEGASAATQLASAARLPPIPTDQMIPEAWFVRTIEALRTQLPSERAERVLARAGRLTSDYVRAHRIPPFARRLLGMLPVRIGLPRLLAAIKRHAWTFVGAGSFQVLGPFPGTLILRNAPTCRTTDPTFGGSYYSAAFEGLLQIVSDRLRVREVECGRETGKHVCRFDIHFQPYENSIAQSA